MKKGIDILGYGSYTPNNIVTNDDLSKIVDTSDEWIAQRTGIRERRIEGRLLASSTIILFHAQTFSKHDFSLLLQNCYKIRHAVSQ